MPAFAPERDRSIPPASLLMTFALAILVAAPAWAERTDIERVGTPFQGSVGFRQSCADLMRVEQQHPSDRVQPRLVEDHEGPERDGLGVNPQSQRVASIPVLPPEMLTGYHGKDPLQQLPLAPQTVGVNFKAATLSGFNPTGSFPPDCDGSIGPTQYLVGVNGRIVSFNKTTGLQDGVLNLSTDNFFNTVRAGSSTSTSRRRTAT